MALVDTGGDVGMEGASGTAWILLVPVCAGRHVLCAAVRPAVAVQGGRAASVPILHRRLGEVFQTLHSLRSYTDPNCLSQYAVRLSVTATSCASVKGTARFRGSWPSSLTDVVYRSA